MNIKYLLAATLFLLSVQTVRAATCTNSYGSTVDCPSNKIMVDKTVRHPVTMTSFLQNITSVNTPYSVGAEVEYEIVVTNQSDVDYSQVLVTDILPLGVTYHGGRGTYTAGNNTLTYTLDNLKSGATDRSRFTAIVKNAAFFNNADLTCDGNKVQNYVKATAPNGDVDEDTANICVQTNVLGVTTLPVAGFEDWAAALPFVATGLAGLGLFIKGRKRRV